MSPGTCRPEIETVAQRAGGEVDVVRRLADRHIPTAPTVSVASRPPSTEDQRGDRRAPGALGFVDIGRGQSEI
jgi:hypothetical protein